MANFNPLTADGGGSGSGGTPASPDTSVQFNDGGSFGGDADFLWSETTNTLTLTGYDNGDPFYATIQGVANAVSTGIRFVGGDQSVADKNGGNIDAFGGAGNGTGNGGSFEWEAGEGGATGSGGSVEMAGGPGGATSGSGGSISLTAGESGGSSGDTANGGTYDLSGGELVFEDTGNGGVFTGRGGNIVVEDHTAYSSLEGGNLNFRGGKVALNSDVDIATGAQLNLNGGAYDGTDETGGSVELTAGSAAGEGEGGGFQMGAGNGGATSGAGGSISLTAGSASGGDSDGGGVSIVAGNNTGAGNDGSVQLQAKGDGLIFKLDGENNQIWMDTVGDSDKAIFSTADLTGNRTFTFPDTTGTLGLKNQEIATQGAGTVYSLTNTAAAIDFGTTDPVITLNVAGTYLIFGQVQLTYTGATVATETATIKVRRTNNTAADLSSVVVLDLPVSTVLTHTYGIFQIPPFTYATTATDDSVTLFANVSAALSAGTIDATAVGTKITAIRLY